MQQPTEMWKKTWRRILSREEILQEPDENELHIQFRANGTE